MSSVDALALLANFPPPRRNPVRRVSRAWRSCHASTELKFHARKGLVTIEQPAIDRCLYFAPKKNKKIKLREKRIRPLTIQVQKLKSADAVRLILPPESVFNPISEVFET